MRAKDERIAELLVFVKRAGQAFKQLKSEQDDINEQFDENVNALWYEEIIQLDENARTLLTSLNERTT